MVVSGDHIRSTLHIAWPIIFGLLGHIATQLADTAMVGWLNYKSLAAAAFANGLFGILMMFGIGLSMGLTPLISGNRDDDRYKKSGSLLRHSLVVNLVVGILIFLVVLSFTPLLDNLGQDPEVAALSKNFFRIIGFSMIPLMIYQSFKQFAEGLAFTRIAMFVSIGGNILNIILNYLLIFGNFGFPRLELEGAGLATLISRIAMAAAMGLYILRNPTFTPYKTFITTGRIVFKEIKRLLRIGLPIGGQFMVEVSAFILAGVMVGWIGAQEQAAHQVALTMASVTYMAASGIASAVMIRVGQFTSQGDSDGVRLAIRSGYQIVMSWMTFTALIFITCRNILPQLFTPEAEVQAITGKLLILAAIFQLSDGIQVLGLGALRGLRDVKIPLLITMLAYWILGLPGGYLFSFNAGLGVEGIWCGYILGLSVAAILLYIRIKLSLRPISQYSHSNTH